jgi:V/A-type H+/Na+-transporting ATPase subunit B
MRRLTGELHARGIYPPVDALSSLSRLMRHGAGAGKTRDDHLDVAAQTLSALAASRRARELAELIGTAALSESDRTYTVFENEFEHLLVSQGPAQSRTLDQTLRRAWQVLGVLPRRELTMISPTMIDKYYQPGSLARSAGSEQSGGVVS